MRWGRSKSGSDTIFRTAHEVYIKELSTLRLRSPASILRMTVM